MILNILMAGWTMQVHEFPDDFLLSWVRLIGWAAQVLISTLDNWRFLPQDTGLIGQSCGICVHADLQNQVRRSPEWESWRNYELQYAK